MKWSEELYPLLKLRSGYWVNYCLRDQETPGVNFYGTEVWPGSASGTQFWSLWSAQVTGLESSGWTRCSLAWVGKSRGHERIQGQDGALFLSSHSYFFILSLVLKTCIQRVQYKNILETSRNSGIMAHPRLLRPSWYFLLILESHMEADLPGVFP